MTRLIAPNSAETAQVLEYLFEQVVCEHPFPVFFDDDGTHTAVIVNVKDEKWDLAQIWLFHAEIQIRETGELPDLYIHEEIPIDLWVVSDAEEKRVQIWWRTPTLEEMDGETKQEGVWPIHPNVILPPRQ